MSTQSHRLPLLEKIGYSLGDAAANLVWRGALAFLAVFYTDTYGLETLAVAALLLIVRLSDGVTDIIMGMVADRTHSRWDESEYMVILSFETWNKNGRRTPYSIKQEIYKDLGMSNN